jgi:hypothetical protein
MRYNFKKLDAMHEWQWLVERAKPCLSEDMRGIVAYHGDKIVAAVAIDNWSYNSGTIHIAVDDPFVFRWGFQNEVFDYIFETCGKGVVIGITPGDNAKALKFNTHMGFKEIYRIRDGYAVGVDYVVTELRKEDWYGKEEHSSAA